jgi:hypothetical protein
VAQDAERSGPRKRLAPSSSGGDILTQVATRMSVPHAGFGASAYLREDVDYPEYFLGIAELRIGWLNPTLSCRHKPRRRLFCEQEGYRSQVR